jgi:hypothetical protein
MVIGVHHQADKTIMMMIMMLLNLQTSTMPQLEPHECSLRVADLVGLL